MRLRPPRLTVRRLMALVAALGLILGGATELSRRHRRFLAAYREHALLEYEAGIKARLCAGTRGFEGTWPSIAEIEAICELDAEERRLFEFERGNLERATSESARKLREKIPVRIDAEGAIDPRNLGGFLRLEAHHRALRRKYREAARSPWLPVRPDPPGPVGPGGT